MAREQAPDDASAARPSRVRGPGVTGDVLVRTVLVGAGVRYTLSEIPGPDQVGFTRLADAARLARDYARERGVDVWSDDGAGRVQQLSRFRLSVASPGPPASQTVTAPESATDAEDEMAGGAPAA